MPRFAAVGAFGTVLNLLIMSVMLGLGTHYLLAAVVATELTILSNFLMQERLVFRDMRQDRPFWQRFAASFGFNTAEALVRMPFVALLVEFELVHSVAAQGLALAAAFLVRFAFASRVILSGPPPGQRARAGPDRTGTSMSRRPRWVVAVLTTALSVGLLSGVVTGPAQAVTPGVKNGSLSSGTGNAFDCFKIGGWGDGNALPVLHHRTGRHRRAGTAVHRQLRVRRPQVHD